MTEEFVRSKEELGEYGYGDPEFLSHEELFKNKNGFIVDGKLVVFVELTVEAEIAKSPQKTACCSSPFKNLFNNETLCDFQLKTSDGEVLKVHKAIIGARSPVFYKVLTTDRAEANKGSEDVPDVDSKVMKEVLRFIYYNEVECLSEIAPELIYAAEKYQLEELKQLCLQEIISSVQVGNAVKFLIIAYQVSDAEELFEKCLDLITNNFCKVCQKPSWKELSKELMSEIIGRLCERFDILKV